MRMALLCDVWAWGAAGTGLSVSLSAQTVGLGIAPLVAKPLQPLRWYRRRNCDELGFSGFLNL
jgi:hypothetical protein